MGLGVELVLYWTEEIALGCWHCDSERGCRNCGIRGGGAGRDAGAFGCRAMGAIVFGCTLPGCPARVWHLVPAPVLCGRIVLSTVRALHRRWPDAWDAHDTDNQHQHPSKLAHAPVHKSTRLRHHIAP